MPVIQSARVTQPRSIVAVAAKFRVGLRFLNYAGSRASKNLAPNGGSYTANGGEIVASRNGPAWNTDAPNDSGVGTVLDMIFFAGESTTTLCVYGEDVVGKSSGRLWENTSGGNFVINKSDSRPFIRLGGSNVLNASSGPQLTTSRRRAALYRVATSQYADVWWDGARQHYATHSIASPTFIITHFGSSGSEEPGDIAMLAVWARILSDRECAELSRNPWQIFEPRRIFFSASAPTFPTLSAATYMPGSLTSTGFRPRVTAS